jgi:guanylate kinase
MGKIFTFSGPRGVGKTTIMDDLRDQYGIMPIVPYATRGMRPGEVDGRDYKFVSPDEFHSIRTTGGGMFDVLTIDDNHYGTPYADFDTVLQSDEPGVKGIRTVNLAATTALRLKAEFNPIYSDLEAGLAVHSLFILPKNFAHIRKQMQEKGIGNGEIEERLRSEPTDLTLLPEFDALIINGYGRRKEALHEAAQFIMHYADVNFENVMTQEAQQPIQLV